MNTITSLYRITFGDISVETPYPSYIRWVENLHSFMTCPEPECEGVWVDVPVEEGEEPKSQYCDIDYKPDRHAGWAVCHIERIREQ